MSEDQTLNTSEEFANLFEKEEINIPQVDDVVKGVVISASKAEVRLDINGVLIGVIRGPELYEEDEEYAGLKPGDKIEATVIDEENENGELELSFRKVGQERAWVALEESFKAKKAIKIKIVDANKGGLLARFRQIQGFLPVSQLAPENYPRVSGGDKGKILEKLKSFVAKEFEVVVMNLDRDDDKVIFSEKDIWSEKQRDVINKYKVGRLIEGNITAVTDFGVFVSFGENLEGLIHISELAWQRIDNPSDLFKVNEKIKAEIINIDGTKIFLSAKKLITDPWKEASKKYKEGQTVKGSVLKVNPFGLFVKLDNEIHGLAHISQLNLTAQQKIHELYKENDELELEIMAIIPDEHRLGLKLAGGKKTKKEKVANKKEEKKADKKEEVKETKEEKVEEKVEEKKEEKKEEVKKEAKEDVEEEKVEETKEEKK